MLTALASTSTAGGEAANAEKIIHDSIITAPSKHTPA